MLGSALHSALSGISAAQFAIGVTANNLANAQTDGFKSSRVLFSEQSPQTFSHGSAASGSGGGRNPTQVGGGVSVAAVSGDFSQSSILLDGGPLDLALEGDGFFVLEGETGEQLFTRDGSFQLNGSGELVSGSGLRVLGFSAGSSDLDSIQIPQGSAAPGAELTNVAVGQDGTVHGQFSDGSSQDLGRLQLVRFSNPNGLVRRGRNTFSAGSNSGLPTPSTGATRILSGARESSNTNIAAEIVNLSRFSTMFRANLLVLETGTEMLDSLLNLRRP